MRKITLSFLICLTLATAIARGDNETSGFIPAPSFWATRSEPSFLSPADFATAVAALQEQFLQICGDTFCAGDYGNLNPLQFDCSVQRTSANVGGCLWLFVASRMRTDTATGGIAPEVKSYACKLPITGTATELSEFLRVASQSGTSGYDGLIKPHLPGSEHTLYQALLGCLGG